MDTRLLLIVALLPGCRKTPPAAPPPPTPPTPLEAPPSTAPSTGPAATATAKPRPMSLGGFTQLINPCHGEVPHGMLFLSPDEGWIGCGEGSGLWYTSDGKNFAKAHPSDDLYVFDLELDPQGRLLVCGHDYDDREGAVLLWRQDGEAWERLLFFGNNKQDPKAATLSNCGQVTVLDSGEILASSNTIGDITWSTDDGVRWHAEERYWEDANLNPNGYGAYPIMVMTSTADGLFAGGTMISKPPTFFGPSQHSRGRFFNMKAHVVDPDIIGEIWGMDTSDGGMTWVVGGRDQALTREPSGFMYRSTDAGETWTKLPMGGRLDVVRDIAFNEDGTLGVAVGHRYPPSKGYVLVSVDAGASWTPLDVDVPPLESVAVSDYTFWVGTDGFLAKGSWR